MAGKSKLALVFILAFYFVRMYFMAPAIFSFQFEQPRVREYLKSQDIPRHVNGRLYLSDEDIHMAAGYLYVYGFDPTAFNFQHPPLIKYLYGYAIRFFGNPYIVQLFFGSALLVLTYFAALRITKKNWVAFLSALFLVTDPVFLDLSQHTLLDLGQAVFAMSYVLAHIYMPSAFVLQGVLLGLFAASKFWSTTLFFIGAVGLYRYLKKTLNIRNFSFQLAIAFVTFSAIYVHSFIKHAPFNIIFFQLKTLKYWLHHSVSSVPGDAALLFLTGHHHMWWQNNEITSVLGWPIMWPIMTVALLISIVAYRKKLTPIFFISLLPLLYVIYISLQAPYMRYFILILPYCYIILFNTISLLIDKKKR
jgi:predicted membrane-bound dolichyl-phosphate-mannose-protein mannosyltransferase